MRRFWMLGATVVCLLIASALPAAGAGTKLFLPMVAREATPTPVPTPIPTPVRIQYRAFMQDDGWLPWQDENGIAGEPGNSKTMYAVEMRVVGGPPGLTIKYRVHLQNVGWQPDFILNGGTAGTAGAAAQIEAIQAGFENAPAGTYLSVEPFIQDWGPSGYVRDFWEAGTTGVGRRLEGFRAYVRTAGVEPARVGVGYNANPRGLGYIGWKKDGESAGTTGQVRPLDTFKVGLFNRPAGMRIQYRCWVQDNDWQPWQDEGGECGMFGTNKAIYAFEMRLVNPWPGSVLSYTAHVQNRGDLTFSSDNPGTNVNGTIGTPTEHFQIEAIKVWVTFPNGAPLLDRLGLRRSGA